MEQPAEVVPGIVAIPDRADIERLLNRYPEISAEEADEIILFLRKAPVLDRGLLASTDELRAKLVSFQEQHRKALGLDSRDWIVVAFILLAIILGCLLLWDSGI